MALTGDRNTHFKDGELIPYPAAEDAVIYAGALVVLDSTGYAAPGSAATGLIYLGRAESAVDNTDGADGAKTVMVRRKKAFKWANSATDAVTQALVGQTCYIEDDQTVCATGTNKSAAGIVLQVESDGVWVEGPAVVADVKLSQAAVQAASTASDVAGLKTDFNALLTKLKNAGLMASA